MSVSKFESHIALRYLTSSKDRFISFTGLLSVIGITLGVATLIIVMSVMKGYEIELIDKILGVNGHLVVRSHDTISNQDYEKIKEELEKISDVKYFAPLYTGQGLITTNNSSQGVYIKGMVGVDIKKKPIMLKNNPGLKLKNFDNGYNVILGIDLARKLGVLENENVKIVVPQITETIFGSMPRIKTFQVAEIFDLGMHEYNQSMIFIPIDKAKILFDAQYSISEIEIVLNDANKLDAVKSVISPFLKGKGLYIEDWVRNNQSLMSALKMERNTMFLILFLIILIAAFNIVSSLVMLTNEKSKNTAILISLGATKISIVKIFMLCGFMLGVIGTFLGSLLGILVSYNLENIKGFFESVSGATIFDPVIYFLSTIPSYPDYKNIVVIIVSSLIISLLSTIYPSYKASKIFPAKALSSN